MTNVQRSHAVLRALGDPTRQEIIEQISQAPASVGEIARVLPVSRSAVSQHLRILKDAELVSDEADGTRRIYRLDPRGIAAVRDWLDAHWGAALDAFAAFANAADDMEQ